MDIKKTLVAGFAALNTACVGLIPGRTGLPVDVPTSGNPWEENKDEHGTTVITYAYTAEEGNFSKKNHEADHDYATPNEKEKKAIKKIFDAYEEVLNLEFVEAKDYHPTESGQENPVDLTIRTAVIESVYRSFTPVPEKPEGMTYVTQGAADIIMARGLNKQKFRDYFEHELNHSLGLEHIDYGSGKQTIMHSRPVFVQDGDPHPNLSDFTALAKMYGARDGEGRGR